METTKKQIPKIFWAIAVIALFWNLIGAFIYLSDLFISSEDIAKMEPGMQELYLNSTIFQKVIYGIGVGGGVLGSIGLLLRKPLAVSFFLISLVGVTLQFCYGVLFTNAVEVLGVTSLIMPAFVILIASFLFWYSRNSRAQGLI